MKSVFSYFRQGLVISKYAWQRNLNYRFTILTYRIGEIAEVLVLILMWSAIYAGGAGTIKGFTENEMITYLLIGNIFSVAVRNFLPGFVSRDINEGRLSMFLVKPISYLKYIFFHEVGRSLLAILVSVASQVLVVAFFLNKIVANTDIRYILLIVAMIFFAFIIELLMGFLIGTIAFWTDEVDGLEATVSRIKKFFSGGYFPLSLLPASLVTVSMYLPFAYSFFMPAQLYLKNISLKQGLQGIFVEVVWVVLLSLIVALVWKRGLKRYEAVGI
ncbi:MAG: ABC-2 family transporter protein [Candidatus Paceibacterota bacterium]